MQQLLRVVQCTVQVSCHVSYPFTQLVHHPTRKQAVLNKIYSSIEDWYFKTFILPSIGTSDHTTISLSSRQSSMKHNNHRVEVKVCSNDINGRNLLAKSLVRM